MHIFGIYYDIYLCSLLPDMVSGKLYQARFDSCCLVNCFSMKPFQGQSAFGFRISFSWAMQMSRRCGTFTLRGGSASNNAHFWRVHKKNNSRCCNMRLDKRNTIDACGLCGAPTQA